MLTLILPESTAKEAEFLDVIGQTYQNFPPCYSHTVTSTNGFSSPTPFEQKWYELGCNVNFVYGNLKYKNS